MQLLTLAVLLLQAATPAQQKRVAWVPNPRMAGGWVADPGHHLTPATVDSLNAMATALERETSDEIAIVIVDSTSGLEPADFALAIHRAWAVGKATRDNGVVVLWVPAQRALQVSVGYGLEGRLIDGRVGRIRDETFFPALRAREFDRAMLDGVGALVAAAREEGVPIDRIKQPASRGGHRDKSAVLALIGSIIASILVLLGLGAWIASVRHRRFHRCPACRSRMRFVEDPQARLAALDAGQRVEERIGSVRHDVWNCPSCGATDADAHAAHLSGFEKCPRCSYRTAKTVRRTVVAATLSHAGEDLLTEHCENCDYRLEHSVVTPRVQPSSAGSSSSGSRGGSSGGGGGGSFGGGSAGGGGAGGHY